MQVAGLGNRHVVELRHRHWPMIHRLLEDNGPQAFDTLLYALSHAGVHYKIGHQYLREEVKQGNLRSTKRGSNQHPHYMLSLASDDLAVARKFKAASV